MDTKISVVIPVYNEEQNLKTLYAELTATIKQITSSYEVIFVNDGSTDKSLQQIKLLKKKDRKIKALSFSRNFGHMAALSAGLSHAGGKHVVIMDADMQDPPKVILKMYKKAKEGFNVVYGKKVNRKESPVRRGMFNLFYKIIDAISPLALPHNVGTFCIIDQKVAKILISLPEKNKYFSGLRTWAGFNQTEVVYERSARYKGSDASLKRLFNLAIDGMVSFSYIPFRLASFVGFAFATIAFIAILIVVIARIFFGVGIIGWASTMITVLLIGGVQLITLGIIGEYLARIYDEVKGRPEYIISEKIGFKS